MLPPGMSALLTFVVALFPSRPVLYRLCRTFS
jgi:hypothetical protein